MNQNLDFTEDMRALFEGDTDGTKTPDEKEHGKKEHEDVTAKAESDQVVEASEESEREEKSQSVESSEDSDVEGSAGREAVADALRGEEEEEESKEESSDEGGEEDKESSREEIKAPEHWPRKERESFKKLPYDSQEFLLNQSKHFQGDYMRKVNDIKGVVEALEPLVDEMARSGVSRSQAVQSLVATHLKMRDTPAEAMKQLFLNYEIDPVDFVSKWDDLKSLNEVMSTKRNAALTEGEKVALESRKRERLVALEEWAKDKKYAEEVEPQMASIVSRFLQQKRQPPHIDEIYDEACWANPSIREKMLEARSLKMSVDEKKRTQRSKKAASAGVRSESEGKQGRITSADMNQREELASLMSKAG